MTLYDFKAFCVAFLAVIALVMFVWYQWQWWIIMVGNVLAIGVNILLVVAILVMAGFMVAWLYYTVAMQRAKVEAERAKADKERAKADHERAKAIAVTQYVVPVQPGHALFTNQALNTIHVPALPSPQQPPMALSDDALEVDPERLFTTFRKAKAIHALIIGARNSGKSTLVNRLLNEEFNQYDTVIIDPLFNQVDSGWLLHSKVKVNRNFVQGLTEFYQSHKKVADTVSTTRKGTTKRLLVIDEFPSLLADLKAKDKRNYDMVMAMLRSIYSQGSHTNHNLMLLSQTVLSEDIGLSSNDKANFIQCCLGSLGGDYLSLRRGKANKKGLYNRLDDISNEYEYYVTFEDNKGQIDVQPLPNLSQFGAKRLYGLEAESVFSDENEGINGLEKETDKLPKNWETIAELLQLGLSANAIYDKIRGNRQDTLTHIRTVKTYLEHCQTGQTNGHGKVVTL